MLAVSRNETKLPVRTVEQRRPLRVGATDRNETGQPSFVVAELVDDDALTGVTRGERRLTGIGARDDGGHAAARKATQHVEIAEQQRWNHAHPSSNRRARTPSRFHPTSPRAAS